MAVAKLYDMAKMTVTGTPGTGTITLNAASAGFQTFAAAGVQNSDVVSYSIVDTGNAWEIGRGTYTTSGTTLSRGAIFSSNSNSAISATSAAVVAISALTEDIMPGYDSATGAVTHTAGATAAASLLTLTGQTGVLAASQPVLNMTQTWNNAGVTFEAIKLNVTNTNSGGSYLLRLQIGGADQFYISKTQVTLAGGIASLGIGSTIIANNSLAMGGSSAFTAAAGGVTITSGTLGSLFLVNQNNLVQLGNTDAAAPAAQTLQVQSVVAGTASHVGADWTLIGSKGTGTTAGAGGKIIFRTAPVNSGTGATAQNATVAALTLTAPPLGGSGGTTTQQPSVLVGNAALATTDTDGFLYIPTCAGTPTGTPTAATGLIPMVFDTTNSQFWFYAGGAWKQPKTPAGAAVVTWQ